MLGAEGLSLGDVQVQASETGMLACTQPACSSATDLGAGCAAIVLGRPRWPEAALAARAQSDGQAAAVLTAWRDGGERVYARLADGALEARDAQGQPLPAAADDVMIPVTFDSAQ